MPERIVFFILSVLMGGTLFLLYAVVRASGLHDRRMKGFSALCLVVPMWILMSATVVIAQDEMFPVFYTMKTAFVDIVPYMSIWFLLHYIESSLVNSRIIKGYLIAMPSVSILSLMTNPLHHFHFITYSNPPELGPFFIGHMTVSVSGLLIMYSLLIKYIIKNYRKQPLILLSGFGALLPIIIYLMYHFSDVVKYDFTAIGYFFTIIIFTYTSYRSRLYSAKPGLLGDTLASIAISPEMSGTKTEDIAGLIAKEACTVLCAYRAGVWMLSAETQTLSNISCYCDSNGGFCKQDDVNLSDFADYKELLETERLVLVSDIHNPQIFAGFTNVYAEEVCSHADAPIRVGNNFAGVLCIEQNRCPAFPERRDWSAEEQSFISSLADLLSIAITNAERNKLMNRLENELVDSHKLRRVVYDNIAIGLITFADDRSIIDCNNAVLSMLDVSEDYFRNNYHKLSPEFQPDGVPSLEKWESYRERVLQGEKVTFEWMHQTPDGDPVPCEITVVRVLQNNNYIGITYVYDMRRINKMLQELRDASVMLEESLHKANEASKAKTDFLAKMSHEIRTPMNAIIGMTELALRESEPDIKDEHIFTVKQAGANLLAIISDILDFSKIEAGKMEIIPSDYSVSSLLDDIVSIIRMRMVDSHVRFAVMVDSKIPHNLYGDETRIRQAVLNILSNAFKYTDKGYVVFSVYGEILSESIMNITFEVTDTGRGIKPDDLGKLFNNFTQVDQESNMGIEGVGLGLAITNSIVCAMGGKIDVKSEYGTGSTFSVTIPQKLTTCERIAEIEHPENAGVIVFERRDVYADSIEYTLGNLGLDYTLVKNLNAFSGKLKSRTYDYLFISYALYSKHKDIIKEFGNDIKVVLLAEFGEAVPYKHLRTLSMPVYCTFVANLINGEYGSHAFDTGKNLLTGFTAPDAHVLVVDDIMTNLKVVEGLLAPYKMRVDICTGGMDAIETVRKSAKGDASNRYDLIFMDHKMPRIDGVEATRRIREMGESDPYFCNIPIIALTANAVSGMREMFMENGFDDYMSKPIDMLTLNSILEKWIRH